MIFNRNREEKISIGVLLAAVITLVANPTFFNPVDAQTPTLLLESPPLGGARAQGTFTCHPSVPLNPPPPPATGQMDFRATGTSEGAVTGGSWGISAGFAGGVGPITGGTVSADSYSLTGRGNSPCPQSLEFSVTISGPCGTNVAIAFTSSGPGGTISGRDIRGDVKCNVSPTPTNNPPTAKDDIATTTSPNSVTINVLANDADPDGDSLTVTGTTDPAGGTATVNPDYTITYTPDQGFSGTDPFDYTISDNRGGTDTGTVTVTVQEPDTDGDGVADSRDNCRDVPNADQANADGDEFGDACDPDDDNDNVPDSQDQCPGEDDRVDVDRDGVPDCIDPLIDSDGDGVSDVEDRCPNGDDRIDADRDGVPDACDPLIDSDRDNVADATDNCPDEPNADQRDTDGDGIGDACDLTPLGDTKQECKNFVTTKEGKKECKDLPPGGS